MATRGFQFQFEVSKITYNSSKHKKELNTTLRAEFQNAAREFVKAAAERVPVYSGMSLGSLIPAARFLKINLNIIPDPEAAKHNKKKNIGAGIRRGDFKFNAAPSRATYRFELGTKVLQYRINEFLNATKYRSPEGRQYFLLKTPGPYFSFERGKAAYNNYVRRVIPKKLPRFKQFISKTNTVSLR